MGQTLPAVVQTFESYSPTTEANDFKLVNSGNASGRLTNATVDTTAPSTALVAGAALIKFSFLIPALQPFVTAVPEPQSWAMLCAGFGMVGVSVRRRRHLQAITG